ncbi:MAG TPA: hypothetical protein VLI04_03530, partial [Nocardioidaceae bacterium]|nr:hypothetical protein [Nocardioidaceae bacterium]
RVTWEPPEGEESLADRLAERLTSMGARRWQIELTSELLVAAIEAAPEAVSDAVAEADPEATT